RRLTREGALHRPELRACERAPCRLTTWSDNARSHLLAAARTRPDRHPGRLAHPCEDSDLHRFPMGARSRLRASGLEERIARRPWAAAHWRSFLRGVQAGSADRDPLELATRGSGDRSALDRAGGSARPL